MSSSGSALLAPTDPPDEWSPRKSDGSIIIVVASFRVAATNVAHDFSPDGSHLARSRSLQTCRRSLTIVPLTIALVIRLDLVLAKPRRRNRTPAAVSLDVPRHRKSVQNVALIRNHRETLRLGYLCCLRRKKNEDLKNSSTHPLFFLSSRG